MAHSLADAVEAELVRLGQMLTEPGQRECLRCYLIRMLNEFGCDNTHRWTRRWWSGCSAAARAAATAR
jgi:hypothetical protein